MELFRRAGLHLGRLRGNVAFGITVVGSIAITLAAATTMFAIVNAFFLSALPYRNADRLVMIWRYPTEAAREDRERWLPLSPGAFTDLSERGQSFERVSAFFSEAITLTEPGEVSRLHALIVTGDFFPLLGMHAAIGRALEPGDGRPDATPVVVLSHDFWQRQFGGDPEVLNRALTFGGGTHEIVGILPHGFRLSESLVSSDPGLSKPVDLWIPFALGDRAHERRFHYLTTIARLGPAVSPEAAQEELIAYASRAAEEHPDTDESYALRVTTLHDQIFGGLRPVLLTLWAATLILLLIACGNLATVLLARMYKKRGDTAVRLALGADRARIVRAWLSECVGLSLLGGALSLVLAFLAIRILTTLSPASVFQSYPPEIGLDVIGFAIALSLVAGLAFGLPPAVLASRTDLATAMSEGTTRLTGRSRLAFSALVAFQIALSTALLVGMGLSFRSFQALLHAELGFNPENVATFELFLPLSKYRETPRKVAFLGEFLERIESLPSVESVGMNYALPLSGVNPSNQFEIDGRESDEDEILSANLGLVNENYFRTLGIPLRRGRPFLPSDNAEAVPVAIVDEVMARQYFGGRDPVGERIRIANNTTLTIVGVVGAVKHEALADVGRPYVYLPYRQRSYMFTRVAVKTNRENPLYLADALRSVAFDLDEGVPISMISTLEESYRKAIAPQRFSFLLMTIFAAISLLLTVIGTYGVMSFLVRQRVQEAGIRMALGATPTQVFGIVFKQGLLLSLSGTALGLAIAVAGGRALGAVAYGVETMDALVFGIVAAITLLGAFLAYYPPARSLSRIQPRRSLQSL